MVEDVRAKRQMANLWGRAVGQLNQKIVDVKLILNEESNPPRFSIEVLDTSNTNRIPETAEIWVIIRNRLRFQRFNCGSLGAPSTPEDIVSGGNEIIAFGDAYGDAKWELKFVDSTEKGRVHAWTDSTKLVPSAPLVRDDYGNALLRITVDQEERLLSEAWGMDFEENDPTILINHRVSELMEKLRGANEVSMMVMPEVLSHVVDRLIRSHCETRITPGTDSWQGRWLTWAYNRVDSRLPDEPGTEDGLIQRFEWKDELLSKLKTDIDQAAKVSRFILGGDTE